MLSILLLIVSSTLSLISYFSAKNALTAEINQNLPSKATDTALLIQGRIDSSITGMNEIALMPSITSMNWDMQKTTLHNASQRYGYIDMGIATPDGTLKFTKGSIVDIKDRPYFKQAITGVSSISDPLISKVTGNIEVIKAVPIKTGNLVSGLVVPGIDGNIFS